MADQAVTLDKLEWQAVLTVMGNAQGPGISWTMVNPLMMKIGQQLQAQEHASSHPMGDGHDSDVTANYHQRQN